ncbi:hypothetical protein C0993_008161, partial [Termitomyces sp. T159_Od127]
PPGLNGDSKEIKEVLPPKYINLKEADLEDCEKERLERKALLDGAVGVGPAQSVHYKISEGCFLRT